MRASPRDQDDAAFASWMKRLQVQEQPGHRFVILEIVHVLDGNEWYASKRPSGPDEALYEACERVGEPRALVEEELLTALRAVPRGLDAHISGLAMLMLRRLIRARRSWYIVLEEYRNTLKERPHLLTALARLFMDAPTRTMRYYQIIVDPQLRSVQREREELLVALLRPERRRPRVPMKKTASTPLPPPPSDSDTDDTDLEAISHSSHAKATRD